MKKDLQKYLNELLHSGNWNLKDGKHIKIIHVKTGRMVVTSRTPSDIRSLTNFQAMVRKVEKSSFSPLPELVL